MISAADKQEFIRISDAPEYQANGRRNWPAIQVELRKSKSSTLQALSKQSTTALSGRRTSYNATAGASRVVTLTKTEALAIHAFASRTGIEVTPNNIANIRSLIEMETRGFRIAADA